MCAADGAPGRARPEHQVALVERMLGTRLEGAGGALEALRVDAPGLFPRPAGIAGLSERMQAMASPTAGARSSWWVRGGRRPSTG
jgi:hypothetical protein